MGYTVHYDRLGNMSIDCDTSEDLQELLAMQRNGKTPSPKRRRKAKPRNENKLSEGLQTEVWNFLCENDSETGCTVEEVQAIIVGLGRAATSTSPTLSALVRHGYAVKLDNENYRAATP